MVAQPKSTRLMLSLRTPSRTDWGFDEPQPCCCHSHNSNIEAPWWENLHMVPSDFITPRFCVWCELQFSHLHLLCKLIVRTKYKHAWKLLSPISGKRNSMTDGSRVVQWIVSPIPSLKELSSKSHRNSQASRKPING